MNRTLLKKAQEKIDVRRRFADERAKANLLVALKEPIEEKQWIKHDTKNNAKAIVKRKVRPTLSVLIILGITNIRKAHIIMAVHMDRIAKILFIFSFG